MSTENLAKFTAAIEQNSAWQEKARAITGSQEECARQLAAFSEEVGFPVTVEEFLSTPNEGPELSSEELSEVAGGLRDRSQSRYRWSPAQGKWVYRIYETE
jgi:predicted ribosomally synthesized peptide with nif11-like leader